MRYLIGLALLLMSYLSFAADTHEFHLKNGLRLIVRENHRAPIVVSSIWYKVGGSYEHNGVTGISHMLEHMMFKGTRRWGPGQLIKLINQQGGLQNAMTASDYTMYYQVLPATQLALSFALEADRMTHLLLRQDLYVKEQQVVMEERRMRVDDDPQGTTWERFNAAAFLNNPSHHPTIGWATDIQHLALQDLQNWYSTWYAANNAVIVVVGDVSAKQVFSLAKKYFAAAQPVNLPTVKLRQEVPALGQKTVTVKRPARLPWLLMGYPVPTLATTQAPWKAYALEALQGILDAGDSARLSRDLVRHQRLVSSAGAAYDLYGLHDGLFVVEGTPTATHSTQEVYHAFLKLIKRLQDNPVDSTELRRVKAQLIASHVYAQDSLTQQAMSLGRLEAVGLSWRDDDAFVARISAVTPQQIQSVAREFLQADHLTVGSLQPFPAGI